MKKPEEDEIESLLRMGRYLNRRAKDPKDKTAAIYLSKMLLFVRDRDGVEQRLFPNKVQLAFEHNRGLRNIVLKARQMGMTTWIAARFFLKTIMGRGVLTVQVAHTQEAAEGIFRMVQRFWERLPEEWREGPLRRSVANVGAMRFPELDSEFRVLSASDEGAGRGLTMQNLHCSEVSRWPGNAQETLAGLRAALSPGGELIIESTPNGAYGCFYEEWRCGVDPGAVDPGGVDPGIAGVDRAVVVRHFFPWWMERAYRGLAVTDLSAEEALLLVRHRLQPEQIGFRRGLESSYRQLRSQEFAEDAETCFRATGDCCFDVEAIEARLVVAGQPVETRRGGALQIWLPYQPGKKYILGVDTAGGGSAGDFAAVQVVEQGSGLQCAELQQHLGQMELAHIAAELAREYGGALIAVERNNHGGGVLAFLQTMEHYRNLYSQSSELGWLTTAASKPLMVSLMGVLLLQSPWMFLSRRLLAECRTFIASQGGKTGAANGAHDDCLMAMAVAQSVRAEVLNGRKVM